MASNETSSGARGVLVIMGPTASGKSALALALAKARNGVVINADSMQVYKRLRILTARPSEAEEAQAPHKLYGWLEPWDVCSAGRWAAAALAEIRAAHAGGKLPIVVGGTGFYIETLIQGLPDAPTTPPEVRAAARAEAAADPAGVHARLAAADPETAARIAPGDVQRLARALEVWRVAGKPPSQALAKTGTPPRGLTFFTVAVMPDREALYARIDARAVLMAEMGAAAEAAALMDVGLDPELPAAKAVGLREFAQATLDDTKLPEAIEATAQASRRYAKRQITWIRQRSEIRLTAKEILNVNNADNFANKIPIL